MPPKPRLYNPKSGEAIWLTWVDALADGVYDGSAADYSPEAPLLHEVGFYVKRDKSTFVMASCHDPKTATFRFMLNIPRPLIRSIRPISTLEVPVATP